MRGTQAATDQAYSWCSRWCPTQGVKCMVMHWQQVRPAAPHLEIQLSWLKASVRG
jgi:hypothetical protein